MYGAVLSHIVSSFCVHYWFVTVCSVINPVSYLMFLPQTGLGRASLHMSTIVFKTQSNLNCFSFSLKLFHVEMEVLADISYHSVHFRESGERWQILWFSCTVLYHHSSHCISIPPIMALFCFKHLYSWNIASRPVGVKDAIFVMFQFCLLIAGVHVLNRTASFRPAHHPIFSLMLPGLRTYH